MKKYFLTCFLFFMCGMYGLYAQVELPSLERVECEKMRELIDISITIPAYHNINCGTPPQAIVIITATNPTAFGLMNLVISSSDGGQIQSQVIIFDGVYSQLFNLPTGSNYSDLPQSVTYEFCLTPPNSFCQICENRTIKYHDGVLIPEGGYTVEEFEWNSGCQDGNFIKWSDLINGAQPIGGSTNDDVLLCCGNSVSDGIEYQANVSGNFSGEVGPGAELGIEIGGGVGVSTALTLVAPADECVFFSVSELVKRYSGIYYQFTDDCSGNFTIENFEYTVPISHTIVPCPVTDLPSPCDIEIDLSPEHPSPGGTGSINIESDHPESINQVIWTGPNGFTDVGLTIENLEDGEYCATITTVCCEEFSTCVVLCASPDYGDWFYDEQSMEYCRQVICGGDVIGLLGNDDSRSSSLDETIYAECISAWELTYSDWVFDLGTLTCTRYVIHNGEVIAQQSKPAGVKEYYDEVLNVCVREYLCDESGDIAELTQQTAPLFGFWMFDTFEEVCYREITCFGTTLNDQRDEEEVDIVWEFNDITGLCEGRPHCDGSPVFSTPLIQQFPFSTGQWQYDSFTGECYRTVQCDFDFDSQTEHRRQGEIVWNFNEITEQCVGTAYCDGSPVFGAFPIYENPTTTPWDLNLDGFNCTRIVYCGPNQDPFTQSVGVTLQEIADTEECGNLTTFLVYCDDYNTGETVCGNNLQSGGNGNRNLKVLGENIKVSPNPFIDELSISLATEQKESLRLSLINVSGQVVYNHQFTSVAGVQELEIADSADLQAGIYFIQITNENGKLIAHTRIVKMASR